MIIHMARIILEASSAFSLTTGVRDHIFDTALVADHNGFPAIPATSVIGVLRSIAVRTWGGEKEVGRVFGFQKTKKDSDGLEADAQASKLKASWGHMLNSQGKCRLDLLSEEEILDDPLYAWAYKELSAPVTVRHRVKLNAQGVAETGAKFDRCVMPKGMRFALELSYEGTEENWKKILELFASPYFRLGGATRSGLGRFKIVQGKQRTFDLSQGQEFEDYIQLDTELNLPADEWGEVAPVCSVESKKYRVKFESFWRTGDAVPIENNQTKPEDVGSYREILINWNKKHSKAFFREEFVIPGSSIKGLLRHRTAFYLRCLEKQWCVDGSAKVDSALNEFFGCVKEDKNGNAGNIIVEDVYLPTRTNSNKLNCYSLNHNSIDRFTGGVRRGALYSEQVVRPGKHFDLSILHLHEKIDKNLEEAFNLAREDLLSGRLNLGAKGAVGHGQLTQVEE